MDITAGISEIPVPDPISQNIDPQADFSRLDGKEMVYWDKQLPQNGRKDGPLHLCLIANTLLKGFPNPSVFVRLYL